MPGCSSRGKCQPGRRAAWGPPSSAIPVRRTRQLKLTSYDRLFPNQDTMPQGGFGNLIALPLQRRPHENGYTVFSTPRICVPCRPVGVPCIPSDGWRRMMWSRHPARDGWSPPLGVTLIDDDDLATPWKREPPSSTKWTGDLPASLTVTLANLLYIEKSQLPQAWPTASFGSRLFREPRVLQGAGDADVHLEQASCHWLCRKLSAAHRAAERLPRSREGFQQDNGMRLELKATSGTSGRPSTSSFIGKLHLDREAAVYAMMEHDIGVLCAPPRRSARRSRPPLIARRGVNTLVLVHRTELLKQWQERLQAFLGIGKDVVGTIGGGKAKPTGKIDIAVMQSLSRQGEIDPVVEKYGHIVVDECHHVGAASFDAILKRTRAKFVLGLDSHADPPRRPTADHLHAMRTDPTYCSETGQRTTRLGSSSALPFFTYRSTVGSRDTGCVPAPCQRPGADGGHCLRGQGSL